MEFINVFKRPVVIISGNYVKKYYTSIDATTQDGFNPLKVALVCTHTQKTHKGKIFRFASDIDICAYEVIKNLCSKEVVKK